MFEFNPLVSVCLITYNQEEYIERSLISILDQVCDFEYEVILSNDASTDNSNHVIQEVIRNHPKGSLVKYFFQSKNLGMNSNLQFVYELCKGEYVAICEGDDYWIDNKKLQKQVNVLVKYPSVSLCFHKVYFLFPNGEYIEDFGVKDICDKQESSIYDLIVFGNYISTASVLFRNNLVKLPISFRKSPFGDYFIWILVSQYGRLFKINEVMSVYRYGVGVYSVKSYFEKNRMLFDFFNLIVKEVHDDLIKKLLMDKIICVKNSFLPLSIQKLNDYSKIFDPYVLVNTVSFFSLFKTFFLKVKNKLF